MKSAAELVRNRRKTHDLAEAARQKASRNLDRLDHMMDDLDTLRRMIKAWAAGTYRQVPWRAVIMATAALIYFVNPLDSIPDMVPFLGFLDDAAMLSFVVAAIRRDLARFMRWEENIRGSDDMTQPPAGQ